MFRLRRYRVYVFFAAILVFLLYRVAQNSEQWETVSAAFPHSVTKPSPPTSNPPSDTSTGISAADDDLPQKILDNTGKDSTAAQIPDLKVPQKADAHRDHDLPHKPPVPVKEEQIPHKANALDDDFDLPHKAPVPIKEGEVLAYDHDGASKATTAPVNVPDKMIGYGGKEADMGSSVKPLSPETIHWEKIPEKFPVPKSDIIPLPAGKPKKIPTIQYAFGKESPEDREKREERLAKVKAEMERGWAGYWEFARGHDELRPVSKGFRDPFCGWAATLVDSLDTLWIMGMEEEFKEAVADVEKIDFTTSKQSEIPVFETTIRYLGGLIAAYDVSGGKAGGFDILLEKAVELAEILMGVFDTPNRMPVLYYGWKPEHASQPKRASASSGVAELGTLAMEFTRLAQLTKENKYYDAVARITDAFYEWQERGTTIPGIFPESIDASGCNSTAQEQLEAAQRADAAEAAKDAQSDSTGGTSIMGDGDESLAVETNFKPINRHGGSDKVKSLVSKRSETSSSLNLNTVKKMKSPKTGKVGSMTAEQALPECVSQGLTSGGWGPQQYGMGGSQDSAYEYFPKQWLLLGGLEPKYKELHLKVSESVRKWLLYRPMVPDDRDILFSSKVTTYGNPDIDLDIQYEVTHLTCFLGGMFGMGGKIFEVPADVEIGKKLTDGCVWAYESTPSGIMPEGATVLPCPDAKNCHWNQTLYDQKLDPHYASRDEEIEKYYERKAKAKAKAAKELEEQNLAEEREAKKLALEKEEKKLAKGKEAIQLAKDAENEASSTSKTGQLKKTTLGDKQSSNSDDTGLATERHAPDHDHARIQKRAPVSPIHDLDNDTTERKPKKVGSSISKAEDDGDSEPAPGFEKLTTEAPVGYPEDETTEKKSVVGNKKVGPSVSKAEDDGDSEPAPGFEKLTTSQAPLQDDEDRAEIDPMRPLSHKEYVANKVENENLPKGFMGVNSKNYILRPEAIESVWYMYRITGDKEWQEKGWKMFEAIVRHTKTEVGNSAIDNVLIKNPFKTNTMESFWTAETLKYFYLLYSDPSVISLDQWVLNTEAHPFKRPKASFAV